MDVLLLFVLAIGQPASRDADELEEFLRRAEIVSHNDIPVGVTRPMKLELSDGARMLRASWKTVDISRPGITRFADGTIEKNFTDSYRNEIAAYELDKLLGLGMVPPTVERRIGGRKGGLQLWVTGVTMEKTEELSGDMEIWRQQVSVMWLFDDLIANIDRHLNNAMVSPEHRLILIDNSKTFRNYRELLNDLDANGTGTHARFWGVPYDQNRDRYPTHYPRAFVERLRAVSDDEIKEAIKRYIWGYDQKLVLMRRELILSRLDGMEGILDSPDSTGE